MSAVVQNIQELLALQSQAGRPLPGICSAVESLKDLCELNDVAVADWRRSGALQGNRNTRPMFKSQSAGSFNKSSSVNSFISTASSPGNVSPGGAPFTPFQATPYSPPARYQSRFKNSSQPVDDKILNNIILSKLNKFSSTTYEDVRDFLYQILGSGESDLVDMVRQFMLLVFKKAASEEVFCALYAKLVAELSVKYKVILEVMHTLQANYLEIFDEVEEVPENGENYAAFVEKNRATRYRQGYSQFLAELAGLEVMELGHLKLTFEKLIGLIQKYISIPDKKTLIEEYADCLVRMSRVLKKKSSPFFNTARSTLMTVCKESIDLLTSKKETYVSLSSKARFILMDVKDNLV